MERLSYNSDSTDGIIKDIFYSQDRVKAKQQLSVEERSILQPAQSPRKVSRLTQGQIVSMNKLRFSDVDYQNLLIEEQELELCIIDKSSLVKSLSNRLKSIQQPLKRLTDQIHKSKTSLQTKSNYIKEYCGYLAERLSGTNASIFNGQSNIVEKQQNEYKTTQKLLNAQIGSLQREIAQREREIDLSDIKSKNLQNQIKAMKKETMPILAIQSKQQVTFRKKEIRKLQELHAKLQQELQVSLKSQKEYQQLNRNLKSLLTVEEEHNNSCMIIERTIIIKETQKVTDQIYKLETSKEIQTRLIPDLTSMLNQEAREGQLLRKRIQQKQKAITELSQRLATKISEWERLEQ